MTDFPLRTDRLLLRPPRAEDAPHIFRLLNDWEVVRNLSRFPFPYTLQDAETWVAAAAEEPAQGRAWHLVIAGEESGADMVIGCIGIRREGRVGQLGYWVGRRFWGHGVATEAVRRAVSWALAQLPIDALEARVAVDNAASTAVLRRLGFRETGTATEEFKALGAAHEVRVFTAGRPEIFGEVVPDHAEDGATRLLLVAACALIDSDGRVLLARRPEGKKLAGLWEFPGGKLHPGETPEAALIRELAEELGIDVAASCLAPFAFASHAYDKFHLLMPLYLCRRWRGLVRPLEGQTLAWVRPARLQEFEMPPADRPLIPLLRDFL